MTTTSTIRQGRPPLGNTVELRLSVRPEVSERLRELAEFGGIPLTQVARTFMEDAMVSAGKLNAAEVESWEHRR